MKNIEYKTNEIANIFTYNRIKWSQFYESERVIIEELKLNKNTLVLDIGCGCGGLGLALKEQFGVENYTGVDINLLAAKTAQNMNKNAYILSGDILDLSQNILKGKCFNVVFSLSCVDWNECFTDMLTASWNHVEPGGHFIATFRLTNDEGCNDIKKSYQYINSDEKKEGELASYVVLNAKKLFQQLDDFNPAEINAHGYWGAPSVTAVTPYDKLCFVAVSLQKRIDDNDLQMKTNLNIPDEIKNNLDL